MTSTPFNVGLNDNRSSSRVLRPPGGGHTDIFGGEAEPHRGRRMQAAILNQEAAKPTNGTEETKQDIPKESHQENGQEQQLPLETAKVEESRAPEPDTPVAEAQKRVRVPPGGFSTPLW